VDGKQFDSLVRSIERRANRRSMLKGLAGSGAAGLAAMGLSGRGDRLAAQDGTPEASPVAEEQHPSYLFVQLAEGGTWMAKPGEPGVYLLTLFAPSGQTVYFSDRPDRIVGTQPTDQFLDRLGFTPYEPPNAAAVVQTPDGTRDVLVVELFNPVYSRSFAEDGGDVLTYEARVLDAYPGEDLAHWSAQADDDQLPQEFTDISLFIDDCADITTCWIKGLGGPFAKVGPIPGGPYGQCATDLSWCIPCSRSTNYYENLCNNTYPQCQGRCYYKWCPDPFFCR
jgi:hypothetical protein